MSHPNDIAVIGIGCRFPGANSPTDLGDLLRSGRSSLAPVPDTRWRLSAANDGVETGLERTCAGLVEDVDGLDRRCFRISANEAPMVDPLQRLFLETSWHALESAGLSPASLDGANIGVYAGVSQSEYALLQAEAGLPGVGNPYQNTGSSASVVAGRVAYSLGLTGPALAIDNACASSLSAVITACESLISGQCEMALAGGAHVILSKKIMKSLAAIGVLSKDGSHLCFDQKANGFVRGEGCGVIALKRIDAALKNGDHIHAVIRGWHQRHNGRTNGLAAPSGDAQAASMSGAIQMAQIEPSQLGYVEAHGSGTSLGDLMEASAIQTACAPTTNKSVVVGSIKSTFGHLEAAAGIAGLIKTVILLRDGFLCTQPGFDTVNEAVARSAPNITIPKVQSNWDEAERNALVNSLGFNGACVHAVVSNGPSRQETTSDTPGLFLVSAACSAALRDRLAQLRTCFEAASDTVSVGQIANSVAARWGGLAYRASFYAHSRPDAVTRLDAWLAEHDPDACRARLPTHLYLDPDDKAWTSVLQVVPKPWKGGGITTVFANLGFTPEQQPGDLIVRAGSANAEAGEIGIELADDPSRALLDAVGQIWCRGVPIDRSKLWPKIAHLQGFELPGYPFQRKTAWAIPRSDAQKTQGS